MDVSAQPHVVRQVPTNVIRIVIDYDRIRVPKPICRKSDIRVGNTPIEVVQEEAGGSAARQPKLMLRTESAAKVPVFPGMVQVKSGIARAGVVPHPLVSGMYMWRFRVFRLVGKMPLLWCTTLWCALLRPALRTAVLLWMACGRRIPMGPGRPATGRRSRMVAALGAAATPFPTAPFLSKPARRA